MKDKSLKLECVYCPGLRHEACKKCWRIYSDPPIDFEGFTGTVKESIWQRIMHAVFNWKESWLRYFKRMVGTV